MCQRKFPEPWHYGLKIFFFPITSPYDEGHSCNNMFQYHEHPELNNLFQNTLLIFSVLFGVTGSIAYL